MTIQDLLRASSRELYQSVYVWFGATDKMTDADWRMVIDAVNGVCDRYKRTAAKEYTIRYAMCLLDELDRQMREVKNVA